MIIPKSYESWVRTWVVYKTICETAKWAESKEAQTSRFILSISLRCFRFFSFLRHRVHCMVCVSELRSLENVMNFEELMNPQANEATLYSWNATVGMFWDFIQTCPTRSFVLINALSLSPPNNPFNAIVTKFQTRVLASSSLSWRLLSGKTHPDLALYSWCLNKYVFFCNFTFIGILLRRAAYNSSNIL